MYYLGIDVSKASHQCVILDINGEALSKSFTLQSSKDDFFKLTQKLSELNIPNNIQDDRFKLLTQRLNLL